jgi:hypothetical protein
MTPDTPWMKYADWVAQQRWMAQREKAVIGHFHCGYSKEELAQLEAGTHYTQVSKEPLP